MMDWQKEILDRTRRVETRLTRFLEAQGFDTQTKKPVWRDGQVVMPSLSCGVRECLDVVPPGWDPAKAVTLVHKGQAVARVYLSPL